jgi:hypothetical protein
MDQESRHRQVHISLNCGQGKIGKKTVAAETRLIEGLGGQILSAPKGMGAAKSREPKSPDSQR